MPRDLRLLFDPTQKLIAIVCRGTSAVRYFRRHLEHEGGGREGDKGRRGTAGGGMVRKVRLSVYHGKFDRGMPGKGARLRARGEQRNAFGKSIASRNIQGSTVAEHNGAL